MNENDSRDAILKNINGALKSRKLYPPGHPAVSAPINKLSTTLEDSLKTTNNIVVGLVNEALVFEDDLIVEGEKLYPDIIRYMNEKSVNAIIFERGFSLKELTALLDVLSGADILTGHALQKDLSARGITHISLKSIPEGKRNILEIYNGAVGVVKNVMGEVRMGKIPRAEPVNEIIGEITESVFSDQNAIVGLTMIKNYDDYLYNHSVNVSIISLSLGRAMKLTEEQLHAVGVAALLHDIGKTGVAENIIRKPGGLSSEEWDKIKEHPLLGSNIIKRMEGMDETIGRLIYEHHVKYDHSGYPQTSSSLHPLSQIITISDAYDALTTLRVYQQPHSPVEAVKVMSNFSGRHFNPDTLKAFVNMIGLYPVGTMVRLSTNEIGLVVKVDCEAGDCPVIKVLYGKDGNELDAPYELSLMENKEVSVVSTVNPASTNTDIVSFFEKEAAAG
ncbi:MAG: HD-GYP domain-containing protein [Deltaproteobacteria bacterium]|nr:HD-GYP domain-containing protein [Deltaproteobacteria bacterium]